MISFGLSHWCSGSARRDFINRGYRRFRHPVNFRIERNDRLYIAKVMYGFIDHESVKMKIVIIDVLYGRLKWRARPHTPALDVAVTDSISETLVAFKQLPV